MPTVHNYEQVMAWQPHDVRNLIGKRVSARAASDGRAFWADPHRYVGDWESLASGLVVDAVYVPDSGGCSGRLIYADGGWLGWISGQPITITETEE